jgi:hypothetical protein
MISIDAQEIKDLERDLERLATRALPFATRSTVNSAAFAAQKVSRENIRSGMINRNKFSVQSVRVRKAVGLKIELQAASVGSIARYMAIQEFGGTKNTAGKKGVPLTTSYASGEGMGTQPRRRLARKRNKLANLKLQRKRKKGANRRQKNIIAIAEAARSGKKFVFLKLARREGIFKVVGGARRGRQKIRMVHDLTNRAVRIPQNRWLLPAVETVRPQIPSMYKKALEFQIKRLGVFKN